MAEALCPGPGHSDECSNWACRRHGCQGRPPSPLVDIACRIGLKCCPYMKCERAGECMAPEAANDNEPPTTS